jgi:hypothetical protein
MMVVGDATGIGKVVCDLIRESGIPIADFNFGGKSCEPGYKNEGTRIWYTVAKMIRESRIVPPNRHLETTKELCAQLSSRRQKFDSGGKLWMETKEEMAARGVNSPDIADAFAMSFGVQPLMSYSYMPFDDSGPGNCASSGLAVYKRRAGLRRQLRRSAHLEPASARRYVGWLRRSVYSLVGGL